MSDFCDMILGSLSYSNFPTVDGILENTNDLVRYIQLSKGGIVFLGYYDLTISNGNLVKVNTTTQMYSPRLGEDSVVREL